MASKSRRSASASTKPRPRTLADPVITGIGRAHGNMAAQVVLRWHFQNGVVAIPKSVHAERIAENMASQAKESDAKAIFIELAGPISGACPTKGRAGARSVALIKGAQFPGRCSGRARAANFRSGSIATFPRHA